MKTFILQLLLAFITITACAQPNADSLAYALQRKKINGMLDDRRQKFGQYSESLSMHTGIFGMQTKKDIRRSNDILMDIVKTDDEIFRQLKVLLDYRAFQQTQVQSHTDQVENDVLGYMVTINKLRDQLTQVKKEAEQQQKEHASSRNICWIIIVLLILAMIVMVRKRTAKI